MAIIIVLMPTTIQISDSTAQQLKKIKLEERANSYDQIIKKLVMERIGAPKSMFGYLKGAAKWSKKDRADFHEF